eukprot:2012826-Amphidinium_carterae.2
MLQIIKATFAEYNLVLNQSAGKTELAVHFATRSSELKAGIMVDSLERGMDIPTLGLPDGTALIVSSTYLYLGRWTDPSCRQSKEIRCRKGQSMAAMRDLQPILKNADVPLALKVDACSTYSVSWFTYCIGTHNLMSKGEYKQLCRAYYKLLFAAASVHLQGPDSHTSYAQVASLTKMPTFSALRYGRVLSLFARLAASRCVLTYSVLALSCESRGSWHSLCVQALSWLQNSTTTFRNVPPPTLDNLPLWAEVTKVLGAVFKLILKHAVRRSAAGTEDELRSELPLLAIESVQEDSTQDRTCQECGRVCKSVAGLACHLRMAHALTSSVATRVTGHTCACCGGVYGSRTVLISHLRPNVSPLCRAHYASLPEAEAPEAAAQRVFRQDCTKRGRKKRVNGLPVSTMVEPMLPD